MACIKPPRNSEVSDRIEEMGFMELRGLSHDYRDLIRGTPKDPGRFRQWLRDRVADQLIAKQYNDEKEWF